MSRKYIVTIILVLVFLSGVTYAVNYTNPRASEITEYSPSHWHDEHGVTHEAVSHSGGTDRHGCHNASVPYHCH